MGYDSFAAHRLDVRSIDDLREAVRGADLDIVQLKPGALEGSLTHTTIGNLDFSVGRFSLDIRARGVLSPSNAILGVVLESCGHVLHWSYRAAPGDFIFFPAGTDYEGSWVGQSAYAALSVHLTDLRSLFADDSQLGDGAFWTKTRHFALPESIRVEVLSRVEALNSVLARQGTLPSGPVAEFLRRSLLEIFAFGILQTFPESADTGSPSLTVISRVEHFLQEAGPRPVHVSEICEALRISRRTLHRAFHDTIGIGPLTFLRRKRLSAVHSVLTQRTEQPLKISDVAFDNGFFELGRFSAYYRKLFGETPSQTLRRSSC